ncbi:laccase, partial [Campylobacter jejuni]|nr:laccase [Campylobacter jejuni]
EILEFAKKEFKEFVQDDKLDLKALVKFQAQNLGIENIKDCGICSFDDESFFSYRRDKTPKRFVSVVYLKD